MTSLIDKLDHLGGFINFPEKDFIAVMVHRYYYSAPNGSLIDLDQKYKINLLYKEYSDEQN